MTRAAQKEKERYHAEVFFRSFFPGDERALVVDSRDPPAPDLLVQGPHPAEIEGAGADGLYVEVREYHPAGGHRAQIQSRGQNELLPLINKARQAKRALKSIAARLDFRKDPLAKR